MWTREVEVFTEHKNAVDNNIKFPQDDVRGDSQHLKPVVTQTGPCQNQKIQSRQRGGDGKTSQHHQCPCHTVHFTPTNIVRQKLVHPKDKTPRHTQSNVVYAVQCSQDCTDLYTGETKQPLHKRMAQHRRANSSGQDSVVH